MAGRRFYGARVTIARESRGLEVEQLAEQIGVEPELVRAWEADEKTPRRAEFARDDVLELVRVLDYRLSFFYSPPEPPSTGFNSIDVHGYEVICDACDKKIETPWEGEVMGDFDFHVWCAPTTT